jgi:preprotein translocase subunit SecA
VEGLNFDTRKNLIDYDSVLSNQRELVYKQRDQILKNLDNIKILKNMAAVVSKDVVNLYKLPTNELYVDAVKLTQAINSKILNANLLSPEIFNNLNLQDATSLLKKILNLSIDTRMKMIGENAKNISKTMMIQNLDHQ